MPQIFPNIIDALNDPSMRHAMFGHFPIVLSVLGLPFAIIAALVKPQQVAMKWTVLAVYLALTLSLYVTRLSGEDAGDAVRGSLSESVEQALEDHEHHGHNLWMWGVGISALLGLSFARPKPVRIGASWLAVVVGLLAAEQIAHTADHGGRLVYEHGVGSPDDLAAIFALPDGAEPGEDPRLAHFREQVRPILLEQCLRCHNPKRARRSGRLDQTTIAGLLTGGLSGPAIVPGKPDESLLITAVRWDDPDLEMPAGEAKLSDEQIAALEKWIADGAVWEEFELKSDGATERRSDEGEGE